MLPSAIPKQYQDVKANLQWYTATVIVLAGILFYLFVLPDPHRKRLDTIFGQIPSSQIVGSGIILVLFSFVGWFLIFALEIHDKIYDRYLTKWRLYYDLDFILPFLARPFTAKLDSRFFQMAAEKEKRHAFMRPFYHFVADGAHEHKIEENLIVRFYEAVTKYWVTQINELILFLLLLLIFSYYFVYSRLSIAVDALLISSFIIAGAFLMNRYAVRRSRETVRKATIDEIEYIHATFPRVLDGQLEALHKKFGLQYGGN